MTEPHTHRTGRKLTFRTWFPVAVFLFFLALWTYELLAEDPVPREILDLIPVSWRFWLAKGLHVAGYAFLTVLAGTLPVPRIGFWLVVGFLILHGVATEAGQKLVAGRTGSLRDVLLDWAGVGFGLLVLQVIKLLRR